MNQHFHVVHDANQEASEISDNGHSPEELINPKINNAGTKSHIIGS